MVSVCLPSDALHLTWVSLGRGQMFKLVLEKAEEPEIKLQISVGSSTPRSGEAAKRSNPTSKEQQLHRHRRDGCEEIPLVQGKEQWLHFAEAAVKRYPTVKVRETQIKW